uniref:Metalloendopeptidase n=1 Tax=Parastrongyloides trichosuri TaxID=131310 RepID=A0A0N5A147_PARTI
MTQLFHVLLTTEKKKTNTIIKSISFNETEIPNLRTKRAILKEQDFNWTFPINYYIWDGINADSVRYALKLIEDETCIRFKEIFSLDNATGLEFVNDQGCSSFLGRVEIDRTQEVGIVCDCQSVSWIMHLVLHSLGVLHEETRPDRNNFVFIDWNNIIKDKTNAFDIDNKSEVETFNLRYDYGSLMHSNGTAYSRNGKQTIITRNILMYRKIGFAKKLSFNDAKLLNFYYCNTTCPQELPCNNHGYTDPNNCSKCKCLPNFVGDRCEKLKENYEVCGPVLRYGFNKSSLLRINGIKSCNFRLKSFNGSKLRLLLESANLPKPTRCTTDTGFEVKYILDKSVLGATFCGINYYRVLTSVGDDVIIHYKGDNENNYFKLFFWTI